MAGGARLRPVIVPPPLFLLLPDFGGANELGSVSSLTFDGTGVELDSDVLSVLSGGWTDGDGSGLMIDDEVGLTSDGNWESTSGERWRTIILLFFAAFDVDLVVVLVDDMVNDGGVDGCRGCEAGVDYGDGCLSESSRCAREGSLITCLRPIQAKLGSPGPGSADPIWSCMYFSSRTNYGVVVVWYSRKIFRMVSCIVKKGDKWRVLMRRIAAHSLWGHFRQRHELASRFATYRPKLFGDLEFGRIVKHRPCASSRSPRRTNQR